MRRNATLSWVPIRMIRIWFVGAKVAFKIIYGQDSSMLASQMVETTWVVDARLP